MATATYVPRLKTLYNAELKAQLKEQLGLDNVNQVPKLDKIVLNIGLGRGKDDKRLFEVATNTLRKITGQQPVETRARRSIAAFKLREGNSVGLKVTLRGDRMYEFLDRLITVVIPRLRDFHGLSTTAFDPQGNYSIGLREQSVFPELTFEDTTVPHGLQINIITTATGPEQGRALLTALGVPFAKEEEKR